MNAGKVVVRGAEYVVRLSHQSGEGGTYLVALNGKDVGRIESSAAAGKLDAFPSPASGFDRDVLDAVASEAKRAGIVT